MARHEAWDLAQMQSLPLEAKKRMTKDRIKVWYETWKRFDICNKATGKTRFKTIAVKDVFTEPPLKKNEYVLAVYDGQAYVSISGGKDSTVLADLCAQVCQENGWVLYLLFVNTGLEYPEIQKFVKTFADYLRQAYSIEVILEIVRPEMRFDEVIKQYGYPVVTKEVSKRLYEYSNAKEKGNLSECLAYQEFNGLRKNNDGESFYNKKQWKFLLDAPFRASHKCCDVMKKAPAKKYEKKTGRKPIIGTMAYESRARKNNWLRFGCNSFDSNRPTSQPLSFWTDQDIYHYIKKFNVPFCSVYGDIVIDDNTEDVLPGQINMIDYLGCYEQNDLLKTTGCDRTGCIFCMFGCHLDKEPNRFQRLKETHPRQYEYCINGGEMVDGMWQPSKQGLGLGKVLDYIGVKYD